MAKVRVYELAKELKVQPKELLELLGTIGVTGKVPSSSIEDTAARSLRQMISNKNNPPAAEAPPEPAAPTAFKTFDRTARRAPVTEVPTDVASDKIEDFREAAPVGGAVVQNPAKSGPGARSDAARMTPPPAPKPAPAPAAPVNRANNGPATPPPATPPAPTPGPAAGGQFGGNRPAFNQNRRTGQNFRNQRGGRRQNRFERTERGPRFGDRNFEIEVDPETLPQADEGTVLTMPSQITVAELAGKIDIAPGELIKKLFAMNVPRAANQPIGIDIASQLVAQYGFTIEVETARAERHLEEENTEELVAAAPVVTIMGHVDHGKTSLLDIIRSANVQGGEAGGITQRIGAYETEHNGETIVFLDTPGHEAFTRMRARGAHVTDIAILVVAADDGVMPQTREAIDHARAARVPIIVAMNKMDRAEADPDRVKGQLAEAGLIPEDYGGDVVVIPVSAKTGQGVQELLDMVLLVTEIQELKANPTGLATGTIIEANQDPNRGAVATVLVHRGTLKVGDDIIVGEVAGRVRAMFDYKGDPVKTAGPKKPVSILGLSATPQASDSLQAVASAKEARERAAQFAEDARAGKFEGSEVSLNELFSRIQKGAAQELNVIVKADGQGSVEAMCQSLQKLEHDEVRVKIISRGVGAVSESDVMLAEASKAIIIAFAVGTDASASSLSDRDHIEIRSYNVIYDAIDDVKDALEGMLTPIYDERLSGEAEVRDTFSSTKAGTIAGCYVQAGKMVAGSTLRVWRGTRQLYDGRLDSLRHVKSVIKEITAGQECGISAHHFNDFREGDILQSVVKVRVKRGIEDEARDPKTVGPPGTNGEI